MVKEIAISDVPSLRVWPAIAGSTPASGPTSAMSPLVSEGKFQGIRNWNVV